MSFLIVFISFSPYNSIVFLSLFFKKALQPKKIFIPLILSDFIIFLKQQEQVTDINKLFSIYFEQIVDGMVYDLYFPELLKQNNRTIIEHLGELPAFTESMSDNQKLEIIIKE